MARCIPPALLLFSTLFAACDAAPVEAPVATDAARAQAAGPVAESAEDGLERVLGLARACVGGAPHNGLGRDDSPLLLDHSMVLEPTADGAWAVSFTEAAPLSEHYGRRVIVDPVAGTCDGAPVTAPGDGPGSSLSGLVDAAFACAAAQSDGYGISGSLLLEEGLSLTVHSGGLLIATVPEADPTTIPSGMDVSLRRDGTDCARTIMD